MRHSIFKTSCTISGKVCDLIINTGSSDNIVSKALVKALKLPTYQHPTPYKITWVMDDTTKAVTESCSFLFSIGKNYVDQITRDVMDLNVCHIILGRPWQYDNKAKYDGYKNTYEIQWGDKKITFLPIQNSTHSHGANQSHLAIDPPQLFYTHLQEAAKG